MSFDELLERLRKDGQPERDADVLNEDFRTEVWRRIAKQKSANPATDVHWWQWMFHDWMSLLRQPAWIAACAVLIALTGFAASEWKERKFPKTGVDAEAALDLHYFQPYMPDAPESRLNALAYNDNDAR